MRQHITRQHAKLYAELAKLPRTTHTQQQQAEADGDEEVDEDEDDPAPLEQVLTAPTISFTFGGLHWQLTTLIKWIALPCN